MMKKLLLTGACVLIVAIVARPVLAEDLNPPPWRDEFCTTLQGWEFKTHYPGPLPPDWGHYLESTEAMVEGHAWWEEKEGMFGVWELSGWIDFIVDNHPVPNPEKWIWIQVTWLPQATGAPPPIVELVDPIGTGPYEPFLTEPIPGTPWLLSKYDIRIFPNPEYEMIHLFGDVDVAEVVIDTWCIPEPATLSLLGLGAFLPLLGRRRR